MYSAHSVNCNSVYWLCTLEAFLPIVQYSVLCFCRLYCCEYSAMFALLFPFVLLVTVTQILVSRFPMSLGKVVEFFSLQGLETALKWF